jgi:hypothetical protein
MINVSPMGAIVASALSDSAPCANGVACKMHCTRSRFPDGTRHRTEERSPTCPPASVPRHPELPGLSPEWIVPGCRRGRRTGLDRALVHPRQGGASCPVPTSCSADGTARRSSVPPDVPGFSTEGVTPGIGPHTNKPGTLSPRRPGPWSTSATIH